MEIKTSEDIVEQYDDDWDNRENNFFTFRDKKWVTVDELIEVIDKLICIGNTQIEVFSNKKLNIIKEALEKH